MCASRLRTQSTCSMVYVAPPARGLRECILANVLVPTSSTCLQILGTTNDRITKTRMKAANHRKAEASEELRAARGFSAAAAESPHRTRPKGYFKGTRKK